MIILHAISFCECDPEKLKLLFNDDSSLLQTINEDVDSIVRNRNERNDRDDRNIYLVSNILAFFILHKEKFHDSLRAALNLVKYFSDKKELIMRSFRNDSMMDYLTDYIIDQAEETSSSDNTNQGRVMFVTWMSVCYSVKDELKFSNSFERMTSNMIHLHGYDGKRITRCVESEDVFATEVELPIISHLKSKIPKFGAFSYASGWFKQNLLVNCLGIKSFLLYCSDWGTDLQQTVKFHDGYNSINSTLRNEILNGESFSFSNRIGELDYLVAFWISIIVLLLTTMFHFILCLASDVHEPMVSFFTGFSNTKHMKTIMNDRKYGGSKKKVKNIMIKVIISLFLPFFSKFFTTFLMPIQIYQFRKNWQKIEDLKLNLHESHNKRWKQFPKKEEDHYCEFCKEDKEFGSFCKFCGFRNANSTTSY